ncbi:hypothetical protein E4U40_005095 [Claviceps sp. LM458 group G5]|nr:hypothetical protein E4U40_005095 [Claviceps sp. LM458 group G5]
MTDSALISFNSTFDLSTLTTPATNAEVGVGIGGLTGIGILSFLFFLIPIWHHEIQLAFKIGLRGDEYHPDEEMPSKHAPHVRVYDNMGKLLARVMRHYFCRNSVENCVAHIHPLKRQPAYAMIGGNKVPLCVAAVGVRYESGDSYGWVGNWAQTCEQPWFYSAHNAMMNNETFGLNCAWIGRRDRSSTHKRHRNYKVGVPTGIRIHFVEFTDAYRAINDDEYYCRENNTALAFHMNKHPGFFDGTSLPERVYTRPPDKRAEGQAEKERARDIASEISSDMWKRSVISHMSHHSAKYLCESSSSAGPSLVAMSERHFCHMPDKVLYRFCADVESGGCWDHEAHRFDAKGPGKIHARAALPNIDFNKPLVWGAPE